MDEIAADFDCPHSLGSQSAVALRREMLSRSHIAPLVKFTAALRTTRPGWEFPEFDPLDGGTEAEILFLFEKPGPMTSAKGGSGFISRNNPDPTAKHTFEFMRDAKIPRRCTVIWNVIPGWNGTRKIEPEELRVGIADLKSLFQLLPNLKSVVLVGRKAQRALAHIERLGIPPDRIFNSSHPSPIVKATRPTEWKQISSKWSQAFAHTAKSELPS